MLRKNVKSFYQWCIENNKQRYIDLWDYELNNKTPKEVAASDSINKYYFKCEKGIHESFLKGINNLINSKDLICPRCNSFYQWCIDNDRMDYVEAWDFSENTVDIYTVSKGSAQKAWFKYPYYSYFYPLSYIVRNGRDDGPDKKYYNSLGYYIINKYGPDAIERYWSNKNDKSPFEYDRGSSLYVWFKCVKKDYHDDYQTHCYSFTGDQETRCPMCASKIIHPRDSFAQFNIDKYGDDWVEKYYCDDNTLDPYKLSAKDNKHKVHIQCMDVDYHDFWITPNNYDRGDHVCHYCNIKGTGGKVHPLDSLGALCPEILSVWSEANTYSPYEISPNSHKSFLLKCENNIHSDYKKKACDYFKHRTCSCPQCSGKSSYEKLVSKYLESLSYMINYEYGCTIIPINPRTGYPLPFDNEIVELKLICEVMGEQHYQLNYFHVLSAIHNNTTPEEEFEYLQWKDNYKKQYAIDHGYYYLELPYWLFSSNEYINVINDKINSIVNQNP